jgi:phage-related protein
MILFHQTAAGRCAVREFLDSLDSKTAQKVIWVLQLIEELDRVPERYFKKLAGSDEIWEVRVHHGAHFIRLFGYFGEGSSLVLTNGFSKKSRKTPIREILTAESCRKEHFARRKNHE